MMMDARSITYLVLMNFVKGGPIILGGGLRKGDPLLPYWFILVAGGFVISHSESD